MQLIRVRFYPATNHRGARLTATNGKSKLSVPYKYKYDGEQELAAANAFCAKFMPYAPPLDPVPGHYNGDNYYHFAHKARS